MNSKYKITKFSKGKLENIEDLISIEEPLEISLKFKDKEKWITKSLSITMRTPGDDEDLVKGFYLMNKLYKILMILSLLKVMEKKLGSIIFKTKF